MRSAFVELPTASTHVWSRAVGLMMIGMPMASSSPGGSSSDRSRTTVGGTGSECSAARAANCALSSIARTRSGFGTMKRNPSASRSRCCETKTIDWTEHYISTGGTACCRANATRRSARASSCR